MSLLIEWAQSKVLKNQHHHKHHFNHHHHCYHNFYLTWYVIYICTDCSHPKIGQTTKFWQCKAYDVATEKSVWGCAVLEQLRRWGGLWGEPAAREASTNTSSPHFSTTTALLQFFTLFFKGFMLATSGTNCLSWFNFTTCICDFFISVQNWAGLWGCHE